MAFHTGFSAQPYSLHSPAMRPCYQPNRRLNVIARREQRALTGLGIKAHLHQPRQGLAIKPSVLGPCHTRRVGRGPWQAFRHALHLFHKMIVAICSMSRPAVGGMLVSCSVLPAAHANSGWHCRLVWWGIAKWNGEQEPRAGAIDSDLQACVTTGSLANTGADLPCANQGALVLQA